MVAHILILPACARVYSGSSKFLPQSRKHVAWITGDAELFYSSTEVQQESHKQSLSDWHRQVSQYSKTSSTNIPNMSE